MLQYIKVMVVILFLGFTACSSGTQSQNSQTESQDASLISAYKSSPITYIPPSVFPAGGSPSANIKIDVFFDPWCPPCRYFDQVVSLLLADKDYGQKVSVYFHLFPLGDHFPKDKEASLLHLEMVKHSLYQEFRTRVVRENISNYNDMQNIAESMLNTKLPISLLEKNNSKIYEGQLKIAKDLKLSHTPTVFINNKEFPSTPSIEVLKKLIDDLNNKGK